MVGATATSARAATGAAPSTSSGSTSPGALSSLASRTAAVPLLPCAAPPGVTTAAGSGARRADE